MPGLRRPGDQSTPDAFRRLIAPLAPCALGFGAFGNGRVRFGHPLLHPLGLLLIGSLERSL
jgi:hypothetical protein